MAKRFGGFTPDQQQTLLSRMGYTGPAQQDDMNKFIMSSPKAASMMGKYAEAAKARVGAMKDRARSNVEGEPRGYLLGGVTEPVISAVASNAAEFNANNADKFDANGDITKIYAKDLPGFQGGDKGGDFPVWTYNGKTYMSESKAKKAQEAAKKAEAATIPKIEPVDPVTPEDSRTALDTAQSNLATQERQLSQYTKQLADMSADDPARANLEELIANQQIAVTNSKAEVQQAQSALELVGMPSTTELRADTFTDPKSLVTEAVVAKTTDAQTEAGKMAVGTGDAGTADTTTQTVAADADTVVAPDVKPAATYTAGTSAEEVQSILDKVEAATGKPSDEALAEAVTMDPEELSQLGLTIEQIENAQKVIAPDRLTVQDDELITGSTVDQARVAAETNFTAATGVPSSEATVQGQLTGLLQQFEGSEPPPWAAGAMRAATAKLAARGLGASSLAGQAIVQAAMESALPIAQADAETRATFERDNLSNRQQAAMFAAEQRSKFLEIEFDQEFQARVKNAARIADVANLNFTAEQQIALENAKMAQTVDIANLDAKNAKILADAAAMTMIDTTNLNNRQSAAVQNANAFLQMDMTNLTNEQATTVLKTQSTVQAILKDTAAANAALQFNALSENQTNQFYDNLVTQVAQHNSEQINLMERFNAGEANAIAISNTQQKNRRDEFNANQSLVIEQANALWAQTITTTDNAAQNLANRDAAIAATGMTETTYNNLLQLERDILDYVWRTADNKLSREGSLLIAQMQTDATLDIEQAKVDMAKGQGAGKLLEMAAEKTLDYLFKR